MKIKLLKILQLLLLFIATVSANCPSQMNFFEPKIPSKIKVYFKK